MDQLGISFLAVQLLQLLCIWQVWEVISCCSPGSLGYHGGSLCPARGYSCAPTDHTRLGKYKYTSSCCWRSLLDQRLQDTWKRLVGKQLRLHCGYVRLSVQVSRRTASWRAKVAKFATKHQLF